MLLSFFPNHREYRFTGKPSSGVNFTDQILETLYIKTKKNILQQNRNSDRRRLAKLNTGRKRGLGFYWHV